MRIHLHVLCFVAFASIAAAQSSQAPFPGAVNINGGWIPCSHAIAIDAGKGCTASTPTDPQPPFPDEPAECIPWPNAYVEPTRAMLCSAARSHDASPSQPRFRVGATYNDPYKLHRMTVLSITLATDAIEVITAQWLTDGGTHRIGDVFAFRVTSTDALIWRERERESERLHD